MNSSLSSDSAKIVSESLPGMQRHRRKLGSAIGRYLAHGGAAHSQRSADIGLVLTDMLFNHADEAAGTFARHRLAETARRHRKLGVTVGDYSCFGDGLGAVMKDVLGTQASPQLLSAWGDAYWAIVRGTHRNDFPIAA